MKLLIMSDIHGNLSALDAVLNSKEAQNVDAVALCGDLIDYGMRSNETVDRIRNLQIPILCNIFGNHEDAIINGRYERFSSDRGRDCARYTRSVLSEQTLNYIKTQMSGEGMREFDIDGKKCLAVHGSLEDKYWKSIFPDSELSAYSRYDYVFSGHSHLPHFFEKYYKCDNPSTRNKKKTVFINSGSVGQPRNLINFAQFAVLDTDSEEVVFKKAAYDIECEQSLYKGQVDDFYKERLKQGV